MSGDASTTELDQQDNADLADFAAGFDDDTTATPTETPAEQQDNATQQEEGTTAPAEPNSSGMNTLDRFSAISRRAMAWPCRWCGVIWCRVLITMGAGFVCSDRITFFAKIRTPKK